MPNIKSAKKRVELNKIKNSKNKAIKSNLKTVIKAAETAIAENAANKAEAVVAAISTIDKAAAKGILHKNTAARKKSSLVKKANA